MTERCKEILSRCLDYLDEIYDNKEILSRCLHYLSEIYEEQEFLDDIQLKIDIISPLVDELRDELWTKLR